MAPVTVYHNPKCSKSRHVLAILESYHIEPELFLYLKEKLTLSRLQKLTMQCNQPIRSLLRKSESVYTTYNLDNIDLDDDAVFKIVLENPILLQRPIVVCNNHAIIARPPETVVSFLNLEEKSNDKSVF